MSDNLYAAPSADLERAVEAVSLNDLKPGDFSIKQCFAETWKACWGNFPQWLGVGIVAMICMLLSAMTIIGYIVLVPVLAWGGVVYTMNTLNGTSQFNDLFVGFKSYGKVLGRMLMMGLILTLGVLLVQAPMQIGMAMDIGVLSAIGGIVYMVGMFFFIRLYFAIFLMIEGDMPAIQAIKGSWKLTQGKGLKVFLLTLSLVGINIVGILALGIGMIPAVFIGYAMFASAYRQLRG